MSATRHRGVLASCESTNLLGVDVDVYVLDGEVRVISTRGFRRALSDGAKDGHFGRSLERLTENSNGFSMGPIYEFKAPSSGRTVRGIEATKLAEFASAITDMKLAGTLHHSREHFVSRARQIEKALSKVALIALVDEATAFQGQRSPDELARKMAEYLLPTPADWSRVFPPVFFKQLARLYRVQLENNTSRPTFFGRFIADYIYGAIDKDVAHELRERNPTPEHGRNHHQHLTPRALVVLRAHLATVTTLMRQSSGPSDFRMRFDCEFRGGGLQLSL
jgi:hypothetical protein